jgi:hypothetical protein
MDVRIKITVEKESLDYKFDMPLPSAGEFVRRIKVILNEYYDKYKYKPAKIEDKKQLSFTFQDIPDYEFESVEYDCTRSGIEGEPVWESNGKKMAMPCLRRLFLNEVRSS